MAEEEKPEQKIEAELVGERVRAEPSDAVREYYDKGRYGEPAQKKFQYSLVEALYLVEREKMAVTKGKKILDYDTLFKFAEKQERNFSIRYAAFKDMRNRGYIVKTALKFGADFRVYDRGVKPGDDHAKWIMYPIAETDSCSWYEFSAKNRVAHSTRKKLLIAIVDDEGDVTYYSVSWTRP